MRIRLIFLAISTFQLFAASFLPEAYAANPSQVYLHKTLAAPLVPQDAFFLIENSKTGLTNRQRGVIVPVDAKDPQNGRWMVGAKIVLPPDAESIKFSVILVGKDNRYFFVPPEVLDNLSGAELSLSASQLKDQLDSKLDELRALEATSKTQTSALNRLRADAEVIGNFNQIFSARDETDRLLADIRGVDNDIETMKNFSKVRPEPANFSRREGELTRQLSELAAAARNAESGEGSRKPNNMEQELKGPPELVQQFQELHKRRLELERQAEELQNY